MISQNLRVLKGEPVCLECRYSSAGKRMKNIPLEEVASHLTGAKLYRCPKCGKLYLKLRKRARKS